MFPSVSVALGAGFHSTVSFEAGHVTFGGLGVNQAKKEGIEKLCEADKPQPTNTKLRHPPLSVDISHDPIHEWIFLSQKRQPRSCLISRFAPVWHPNWIASSQPGN